MIPSSPFKVLDAPYLQDDYYLNVIDWSISNNLLVGLANSIYIWNFHSNDVQKVKEFPEYNILSGVSWDLKSEKFCIGLLNG